MATLRGQYNLNDRAGDTVVLSDVTGTNGTLMGGKNTEDVSIVGLVDRGFYFDGTNDYIQCDFRTATLNSGGISVFFRLASTTVAADMYICGREAGGAPDAANDNLGIYIRASDNKVVGYQYYLGMRDAISDNGISDTNWHHVYFEWGSGTATNRMWLDGVLQVDTGNGAELGNSTARFGIGSSNGDSAAGLFKGRIESLRIYYTKLKWGEIGEIYNYGAGYNGEISAKSVTYYTSTIGAAQGTGYAKSNPLITSAGSISVRSSDSNRIMIAIVSAYSKWGISSVNFDSVYYTSDSEGTIYLDKVYEYTLPKRDLSDPIYQYVNPNDNHWKFAIYVKVAPPKASTKKAYCKVLGLVEQATLSIFSLYNAYQGDYTYLRNLFVKSAYHYDLESPASISCNYTNSVYGSMAILCVYNHTRPYTVNYPDWDTSPQAVLIGSGNWYSRVDGTGSTVSDSGGVHYSYYSPTATRNNRLVFNDDDDPGRLIDWYITAIDIRPSNYRPPLSGEDEMNEAYMMEFGQEYIRFFRNSGSLVSSDVDITGATKADPCVITCNTASLSNGNAIDISGVEGMTELNGRRFLVANKTSTTVELQDEDGVNINSTGYTTYTASGVFNKIYEVVTPYDAEDVDRLKYSQQADIMYFCHPNYPVMKLSRYANTTWTFNEIEFDTFSWPPFLPINVEATTLACAATTGTGKALVASAPLFSEKHVGAYFKLDHGESSGYVQITAVTDSELATCTIISELGSTDATDDWYEGAWSDYQGYPADCKFYEQRLYFVSTRKKPLTVWGSEPESYENFKMGSTDDDAIMYTLGSNQVDKIVWAYPADGMVLGTAGGPFTMTSGSSAEPISATNVSVKQQNENGVLSVSPVRIGPFVYYVEKSGRMIGQFSYSLDYDNFETINITYLNDHILGDIVVDMAVQKYPFNILWAVRSDGQIATMTREIQNNIKGWTRQKYTGNIENVAVIPYGREDQVWVINNLNDKRYVNFYETHEFSRQDDAFFIENGLTYNGEPVSTVSGLDHLEGEEVQILIDGAVHPNRTVTDGSISLEWDGATIHVGLGYKSTVKTMDLDAGEGMSQGEVTHISKVIVRFLESLGCKVGDGVTQDVIPFKNWGDPFNTPLALFTGDKEVMFPSGHVKNKHIVVEQDQPLPLQLLGLFPRMTISS